MYRVIVRCAVRGFEGPLKGGSIMDRHGAHAQLAANATLVPGETGWYPQGISWG